MLPGERDTLGDLPSLLGRRKSASARELGGAHAGGSPGNRRYQLQHVAWEAGSWFCCPKLITQVPAHVLLLWQSWGASPKLSAASPGRPAALPTLPRWTTVLPVLASGRWRKGTSYWEDAPAVHSRAQDHPAAFQKGLGTHVTQPTVLLTWHSPACPWWRPAGALCPRSHPAPALAAHGLCYNILQLLGFPLAQIPVPPTPSAPTARRSGDVPVPSVSDQICRLPPRVLRLEQLLKSHLGRREPEIAKE